MSPRHGPYYSSASLKSGEGRRATLIILEPVNGNYLPHQLYAIVGSRLVIECAPRIVSQRARMWVRTVSEIVCILYTVYRNQCFTL